MYDKKAMGGEKGNPSGLLLPLLNVRKKHWCNKQCDIDGSNVPIAMYVR